MLAYPFHSCTKSMGLRSAWISQGAPPCSLRRSIGRSGPMSTSSGRAAHLGTFASSRVGHRDDVRPARRLDEARQAANWAVEHFWRSI